jgi:large subunit ribosomal protein L1
MGKRGKNYREAVKDFESAAVIPLDEAIEKIKKMAYAKFDETVEVAIRLNLKKNQSLRDTMVLPNQFQKGKKILVFAKGEKADEAREAGAAYVGDADLVEKIKGGWLDFDVAVATPDMMKEVGKLGPVLGRRGLMPNPKTQTVTFDIRQAIAELQKGRMEFRADKTGVVHLAVGKLSMDSGKIQENAQLFIEGVKRRKPSDLKGEFIRSISISSTMSPGVKVLTQ